MSVQIHKSWKKELAQEFEKPYFGDIKSFLRSEIESEKIIYPHPRNIFHIFNIVPFEKVRVVVLGQDPYHGAGQAHGMSFSVQEGTKIPPSLRNIFKELESEGLLEKNSPLAPLQERGTRHEDSSNSFPLLERDGGRVGNGDLTPWAQQGVFLLNSILTVEAGKPASHSKIGWENFTDAVIQKISSEREAIVFLLWGNFAKTKKTLIDTSKHLVLEAPHPSPFSAHSGFFGCDHFKKVNKYLKENGEKEIDWRI